MKPIKKWMCMACGAVYEHRTNADDCSCHGVRAFFVCPFCDLDCSTEAECVECIDSHRPDDDEHLRPPPPTAAELEAAGQARLLP